MTARGDSRARVRWCAMALAAIVATVAAQDPPPTVRVPPAPPTAAPGVSYEDVTDAAGITGFTNVSGDPRKLYVFETTGSGVAVFDADNDGDVDLYLLNGSTKEAIRSGSPAPPAAFFRNDGNGTFTNVTASAGLANERWGQGVCVGDADNDGTEEIYVTNIGKNRLYQSQGTARSTKTSPRRRGSRSTAGRRAARSGTTTATAGSTCSWPAT